MTVGTLNQIGAFRLSRERQLPKPEWWIDRFLIKGSVTMMTAQPKVGKSAFAAKLSHAVATGSDFFGRAVPKGEVLYIAGERAAQTEDRVLELFEDDSTYIGDVILIDTEDERLGHVFKFNTNAEDNAANLKFVRDTLGARPTLIVIDTLTSYFEGEVTNPEHMKRFMDGVRRLAKPFGAQALVLHHDTKEYVSRNGFRTGGDSYNGSIQGLARVDSWLRAIVRKEVPDPDDPYGQTDIKLVDFELQDDNFGGGFSYVAAVKKQLEDATSYLNVVNEKREAQKKIILEVINKQENHVSETTWLSLCKSAENFGTMGKETFSNIIKGFVLDGLVQDHKHPTHDNWKVYSGIPE